jgi:hypothetical protein
VGSPGGDGQCPSASSAIAPPEEGALPGTAGDEGGRRSFEHAKTARAHKTEYQASPRTMDRVIVDQIQKLDFKWEN